MEISRKSCRLCIAETEFNVSLFGSYCQRTNMIDKILVCLKIVIEETDSLNTICYKCAENIERCYNFLMFVKKSQTKLVEPRKKVENSPMNCRHVTSYVREQVYDADYTFSFLEIPNNEEKPQNKPSSPFFSYFSSPNLITKRPGGEHVWKTPPPRCNDLEKKDSGRNRMQCKSDRPRHHSRDLFESQSQDVDEPRSFDWKLTPDDNILKRIRNKCFERSDF